MDKNGSKWTKKNQTRLIAGNQLGALVAQKMTRAVKSSIFGKSTKLYN